MDDKNDLQDLHKHDFIGGAEFMLHDMMRAPAQTLKLTLTQTSGKKTGTAILQAEQLKERLSSNIAKICIEGTDIKGKGGLFYKLLRASDSSGDFVPVYQSEAFKGTGGNYKWKPVKIGTATLFRDNDQKPLQIELYEYNSSGNHKLLDKSGFNFASIIDGYQWVSSVGTISFKNVEVQKRASFLDYLFGGCNIALTIAVDFTGSNRDPTDPNSLHYIDPRNLLSN